MDRNLGTIEKEFSWRESAIIFSDKRSNGRSADFFIAEATVIGLDNEADYYKEHVPFSQVFYFVVELKTNLNVPSMFVFTANTLTNIFVDSSN